MAKGISLAIVVAVADNGVIGAEGGLPWNISADLKRVKELTVGKPLLMGRKTYDSIGRPESIKPRSTARLLVTHIFLNITRLNGRRRNVCLSRRVMLQRLNIVSFGLTEYLNSTIPPLHSRKRQSLVVFSDPLL